jgi:hypothetical protein
MKRNTPIHPKLIQLAAELKIRKYAAVGLLELLWHMTAQFAPEGDVGRFQDSEISRQLDWLGDPPRLIAALVNCRWLDKHPTKRLIVHDWSTHSDSTCDKYLSDSGRRYADGKPPRRKGDLPLPNLTSGTTSRDKSGQVATSRDKSRLPMPKPLAPCPSPLPVPVPLPEAPPPADLLAQVKKIKSIRKEFGALRDVDLKNALKEFPEECWDAAIADFERDWAGNPTAPEVPIKNLRAYLEVAEKENAGAGGGDSSDEDAPTDTEELERKASFAMAAARGRTLAAAADKKAKGKHGRK